MATFVAVLDAECRQLAAEARKQDGFAGWLTGPSHLDVKDAAERAVLKLRSLSTGSGSPAQAIANCEARLVPILFLNLAVLLMLLRLLRSELNENDGCRKL